MGCLPSFVRLITVALIACLINACASKPDQQFKARELAPEPEFSQEPLADEDLAIAAIQPADAFLLSVGVVTFEDDASHRDRGDVDAQVLAEINQNEAKYIPYLLRNTLTASNQWGVVRVLPETDPSVDLNLYGKILKSTGLELVLQIRAVDSTGRVWLDKIYRDLASLEHYPEAHHFSAWNRFDPQSFIDPFQNTYHQIANDLLEARTQLGEKVSEEVQQVSRLVYAQDLSPSAFVGTLTTNSDGLKQPARLLARDDPALQRVEEIHARHEIFIDSVDEYYQALFEEMQPLYVVWRRYSYDEVVAEQQDLEQLSATSNANHRDNYASLVDRYDRYKWSKIYQQEFTELATGFNNEIAPAVLELNRRVYGLTGSMDNQYRQWRDILRQMYELETGLPPLPPK